MLGEKAIGIAATLLIVGAVAGGGIGAYLLLSQATTEIRTVKIRHKQTKALKAKLDFDHAKYLLNDSVWLGGQQAAWEEGNSSRLWQAGNIPNRSTIESSLSDEIREDINSYIDKIRREGEGEFETKLGLTGSSSSTNIENESFQVNISTTLVASFNEPFLRIRDKFNYSRNFSLRYGLLYENGRSLAQDIEDFSFARDKTARLRKCKKVYDTAAVHKAFTQYIPALEDNISSIQSSFSPDPGITLQGVELVDFGYSVSVNTLPSGGPCLYEMTSHSGCDDTCDDELDNNRSDIGDSNSPYIVHYYPDLPTSGSSTYQEDKGASSWDDNSSYDSESCDTHLNPDDNCNPCGCGDWDYEWQCGGCDPGWNPVDSIKICWNESGCGGTIVGCGSPDKESTEELCKDCIGCNHDCYNCEYRYPGPDGGNKWFWKTKDATVTGKWIEVNFTLVDSRSEILTTNGYKNLTFVRRFNVTIP